MRTYPVQNWNIGTELLHDFGPFTDSMGVVANPDKIVYTVTPPIAAATSYEWLLAGGGDAELTNPNDGMFHTSFFVTEKGLHTVTFQAWVFAESLTQACLTETRAFRGDPV